MRWCGECEVGESVCGGVEAGSVTTASWEMKGEDLSGVGADQTEEKMLMKRKFRPLESALFGR